MPIFVSATATQLIGPVFSGVALAGRNFLQYFTPLDSEGRAIPEPGSLWLMGIALTILFSGTKLAPNSICTAITKSIVKIWPLN